MLQGSSEVKKEPLLPTGKAVLKLDLGTKSFTNSPCCHLSIGTTFFYGLSVHTSVSALGTKCIEHNQQF